jgi:hypothetical protein
MKAIQFIALAAGILAGQLSVFAQTWSQSDSPSDVWSSIASSADGTKFVAATLSYVYTSTNSGVSWNKVNTPRSYLWKSVASSADGSKLVVAGNSAGGSPILISTNSGASWVTSSVPFTSWTSVASSADGTKLFAAYSGGLYISTNSGASWIQQPNPTSLSSVACSADGSRLVASVPYGSFIYSSTDAGVTWFSNSLPSGYWNSVASSADGKFLVAAGTYNPIYVSTNFGVSWKQSLRVNPNPFGPDAMWSSVACSAEGRKMIAACSYHSGFPNGFSVQISTNAGSSWSIANSMNKTWNSIACSADAETLAVAGNDTAIYSSRTIASPKMSITSDNGNPSVSWLISSTTNFVLQHSPDLQCWTDITNSPVLNLTNLQNQVSLPAASGSVFFRLKTP